MKFSIALVALAATASALPKPPTQINSGPLSLRLDAPGTEYHDLYISLHPTSSEQSNNYKTLAITSTSKEPNPRFEIVYNNAAEDPRFPAFGKLIYTPGTTDNECKFFSCPPKAIPAGYDKEFGPIEYVRNNMQAMLFPASASAGVSVSSNSETPKEQLHIWNDFQLDFSGHLTLNGRSSWFACPTKYPFEGETTYTSIWWAEGMVTDDRCKQVKIRRS